MSKLMPLICIDVYNMIIFILLNIANPILCILSLYKLLLSYVIFNMLLQCYVLHKNYMLTFVVSLISL